jgi:hypothetical protein
MRVADDHRAPGADVVDVALAVGVPHIGALGAGDEARRAAHRTEGADGRVDAAGNGLLGAIEKLLVTGHGNLAEKDSGGKQASGRGRVGFEMLKI